MTHYRSFNQAMRQRFGRKMYKLALDGGMDGLDLYRRIAQGASAHLNPGGYIYLEVGIGEAKDVLTLINENIKIP